MQRIGGAGVEARGAMVERRGREGNVAKEGGIAQAAVDMQAN